MVWITPPVLNAIADKLVALGVGERKVNYRLRDWGFPVSVTRGTNPDGNPEDGTRGSGS